MTRKDVHYIHINPEISREEKLHTLINHLKKQGWIFTDFKKKKEKEKDTGKKN